MGIRKIGIQFWKALTGRNPSNAQMERVDAEVLSVGKRRLDFLLRDTGVLVRAKRGFNPQELAKELTSAIGKIPEKTEVSIAVAGEAEEIESRSTKILSPRDNLILATRDLLAYDFGMSRRKFLKTSGLVAVEMGTKVEIPSWIFPQHIPEFSWPKIVNEIIIGSMRLLDGFYYLLPASQENVGKATIDAINCKQIKAEISLTEIEKEVRDARAYLITLYTKQAEREGNLPVSKADIKKHRIPTLANLDETRPYYEDLDYVLLERKKEIIRAIICDPLVKPGILSEQITERIGYYNFWYAKAVNEFAELIGDEEPLVWVPPKGFWETYEELPSLSSDLKKGLMQRQMQRTKEAKRLRMRQRMDRMERRIEQNRAREENFWPIPWLGIRQGPFGRQVVFHLGMELPFVEGYDYILPWGI